MTDPSRLHDLRRPLRVAVHEDMGLGTGELVAVGSSELRFWSGEDLLVGTRSDLRVDLGAGAGNADLEIIIRVQEGPWSGRARGFGHRATWTGRNASHRRRLLDSVRSQLPDVWFADADPPSPSPAPAPSRASSERGSPTSVGHSVMVAPGPTPTVAVTCADHQAVRVGLRLRNGRAVLRLGKPAGLSPGDRIILVLRLPDGTFQQHTGSVVAGEGRALCPDGRGGPAARIHLERAIKSAGVNR